MKKEIEEKPEFTYREPQNIFSWWFSLKGSFSIIKIPIAIILVLFFLDTLIVGFSYLIDAIRNEPLFTGVMIFILFPILVTFFPGPIFWGGLFYLPYYIFEEEKKGWKALLGYIGLLIIVSVILTLINMFVFGWAYSPF